MRWEEAVAAAWAAVTHAYVLAALTFIAVRVSQAPRPKAERRPIPMRLPCPECRKLHVDRGAFATKAHHTHACQFCGHVWRPAVEETVGVRFLPGFKDPELPT